MRGGVAREQRSVLFGGTLHRRRRRPLRALWLVTLGVAAGTAVAVLPSDARGPRSAPPVAQVGPAPAPPVDDGRGATEVLYPAIAWRRSRALGATNGGRLHNGVRLPAEGPDWFTLNPVTGASPNLPWRRWGTDGLLRTLMAVLREHRAADPGAPRVGIGDLSRHRGGPFGRRFGGLGHASHQNGLDADVYYPRRDSAERSPQTPRDVDRRRAQDLVDRFVAAGAEHVFVGRSLDLRGPKDVVIPLAHHDDHLHVRIPPPPR